MSKIEFNSNSDWYEYLQDELKKDYFKELINFVEREYDTRICYPPIPQIFNAFYLCSFSQLKVVILGQDPYHGKGQAHGLCFSVNDGIAFPPSLKNIFKEIEADTSKAIPENGDLTSWAKQGTLLLNSTLSVEAAKAGSHQGKGWEKFTDQIIQLIGERKKNVVFMLWGAYAQKKAKLIDAKKHLILTSGHPSPLSANRGYWFGNNHFSEANNYLIKHGKDPIEW